VNENGINEISLTVKDFNINDLKTLADQLRNKFDNLIVILKSQSAANNFLVVAVSENLQNDYSALEIFKALPEKPRGGGNKNLAQGKY
jgi:alanyl-tRNA synthetase